MKLQTSVKDEVTLMTISGELNTDSVRRFKEIVTEAFANQRRDFVVDLAGITSIDSAGLEALTALQRECDEQLGMVRFCGADETTSKIFEITRLDKLFALHSGVEEALGTFTQG